jgi:hypothetical protein
MSRISNQYIKDFFEKRERKNPLLVKTRYGKQIGEKFSMNIQKADEWAATRKRQQSLSNGNS